MESNQATPHRRRNRASKTADFCADEQGAIFLEFLIVLFPFMFILFGVAQAGLLVMAGLYTNYANFMALRAAAVQWELRENGFISQSEYNDRCEETAMAALGPIEPFVYKNYYSKVNGIGFPTGEGLIQRIMLRLRVDFISQAVAGSGNPPAEIQGRLEYEYPLVMPFAGGVIAALGRTDAPTAGDNATNRVMHEFISDLPKMQYLLSFPSITLRSSNDAPNGVAGSGPPFFHKTVVQRRWLYPQGPDVK